MSQMSITMTIDPTRKDRHRQAIKAQIARCLEQELGLRLEERRERAKLLGIESMIATHQDRGSVDRRHSVQSLFDHD